ncbi:MAG TPA: hypothetical protein ENK80_05860 [Rhodobacterales bacterium]|nr:hypothetical protein [Rhodobacterales bacterium]
MKGILVRFVQAALLAALGVLSAAAVVLTLSAIIFQDSFPGFALFRVYSFGAFVAIWMVVSILLGLAIRLRNFFLVSIVVGPVFYSMVGLIGYMSTDLYSNWGDAIAGPSTVFTSLVVNGGFLAAFGILSGVFAIGIRKLLARQQGRPTE